MSKHTPGPWQVEERFSDRQVICTAKVEDGVKEVIAVGGNSTATQLANARLIAAAPDLLAALKLTRDVLVVACGDRAPYIRQALAVIHRAIDKVEGKQ